MFKGDPYIVRIGRDTRLSILNFFSSRKFETFIKKLKRNFANLISSWLLDGDHVELDDHRHIRSFGK